MNDEEPAPRDEERLLPVVDEHGVFHPKRLRAVDKLLARVFKDAPQLPPEALRREALYEDHD